MTDSIKRAWLGMSEARLRNHLVQTVKLPPPVVAEIVAQVRLTKAQRKAERIKKTVVMKLWDEMLEPARVEIQIVRTMKHRMTKDDEPNPEKWEALCTYETAIAKTIEKLRKVQRMGAVTPKDWPDHLRKAKVKKLPANNGEHWTDYVDSETRASVEDKFAAMPVSKRGMTKEPFLRRLSAAQYKQQRFALLQRLSTEQQNAERQYEVTEDDDERRRLNDLLEQMGKAQFMLDQMKPNAPLPRTWHGLLVQDYDTLPLRLRRQQQLLNAKQSKKE